MKPNSEEAGRMWRENQQLLRLYFEGLIRHNKLSKLAVIAEETNMTASEFSSKISITPRTPLTRAELVSLEHELYKRDPEAYAQYLRDWHGNPDICIAQNESREAAL